MMRMPAWRDEREHEIKAERVRAGTAAAYREAARQDETARTTPRQLEDAEGYVEMDRPPGATWTGPQDDEWLDGEPWTWLHGDCSTGVHAAGPGVDRGHRDG